MLSFCVYSEKGEGGKGTGGVPVVCSCKTEHRLFSSAVRGPDSNNSRHFSSIKNIAPAVASNGKPSGEAIKNVVLCTINVWWEEVLKCVRVQS